VGLGLLPAWVAVVYFIAVVTSVKAGLKWSNDVLVGDRKRARIVAEDAPSGTVVAIGAGVSVTLRPDDVVGDPRVTSPLELKVRNFDRGVLAARLPLINRVHRPRSPTAAKSGSPMRTARWRRRCLHRSRPLVCGLFSL
jgi:biotin-(acetyl-CoA carboxylase) ligase